MTAGELVIPGGICCQDLVELVTAYLDGALSDAEHTSMSTHLQACAACAEYVEQVRVTARMAEVAAVELELRPDGESLLRAFREFQAGG